jgi:hypothetical protein
MYHTSIILASIAFFHTVGTTRNNNKYKRKKTIKSDTDITSHIC